MINLKNGEADAPNDITSTHRGQTFSLIGFQGNEIETYPREAWEIAYTESLISSFCSTTASCFVLADLALRDVNLLL